MWRACKRSGGALREKARVDENELRWPGYTSDADYREGRGILLHPQPTGTRHPRMYGMTRLGNGPTQNQSRPRIARHPRSESMVATSNAYDEL